MIDPHTHEGEDVGTQRDIAEAFSSHRFADTYDSLAPDVRWVAIGDGLTVGRDAVVDVCEGTLRALAGTTTEFLRFVVADGGDTVAVDAVGRYVDATGEATAVASCDVFEFRNGQVRQITSYTVEVDPPLASAD